MQRYQYIAARQSARPMRRRIFLRIAPLFAVVVLTSVAALVFYFHTRSTPVPVASTADAGKTNHPAVPAASPQAQQSPSVCAAATETKVVYVSVGKRHMWACNGTTQAYDSPVVTGMENLAADLTPRGTYHIYGKQTDLYLNGSDSTGSWHDYVYYWMPFLSNQYGVYGFHDATWRKPNDFGNIDPNSNDASHGCVELPLETAKWLYGWAPVGTSVIITD
jgi:lipoprotein-anchoring transpeptidase ErfK/SrfK